MYEDRREIIVEVPPERAFVPIQRIGGKRGWYHLNALWTIRGWLDVLVGGPGLRGRKHDDLLSVGDQVDWWVVEAYEQDRMLRLRAEMKVPGTAWLEFRVAPTNAGGSHITQTATYNPGNFFGHVYWCAMWPFHQFLFPGMLRAIARNAVGTA